MLTKLIKEPLFHFICLGCILFAINHVMSDDNDDTQQINIDKTMINQLVTEWQQTHSDPLDQTTLDHLIEQRIKQEVLYREALQLELDKRDPVIRQRLAQKVVMLNDGFTQPAIPAQQDLKAFYNGHKALFKPQPQISFEQIFVDPLQHPDGQQQASQWLTAPQQNNDAMVGDPSSLARQYRNITLAGVQRLFGEVFSQQLFDQQAGEWRGPIQSQYGLHLIKISQRLDPPAPEFSQIEDEVALVYQQQQRQQAEQRYYQTLRAQYQLNIAPYSLESH